MTYEFDAETAIYPAGEGRYMSLLTDRWNTFTSPNGGYVLAIAARALSDTLPHRDPLSVTGHFVRPSAPGPAEVEVELVRAGMRHSTGMAQLRQDGREVLRVLATYASLPDKPARTATYSDPPSLPPPEECLHATDSLPIELPPVGERVDFRVLEVPGWASGMPSGRATNEFWGRFADGRPADPIGCVFLVDSAPPASLELGLFGAATVELTVHVRARPAPGWLAFRHSTSFVTDAYLEEDLEIWDSRGVLVAQSRQLAILMP